MKINKKGQLFIISGSSGAGKTALTLNAINKNPGVSKVITYTTKNPGIGEVNGVDYFFLREDEFKEKIKENFFLEYSNDYGAYYGTSANILNDIYEGRSLICVTDLKGVQSFAQHKFEFLTSVWIQTSLGKLKERLVLRGRDSDEIIEKRLQIAALEIEK